MIRGLGIVTVVAFLLVSFTPLPNVLNQWAGVAAQLQPAAAAYNAVLRIRPTSYHARRGLERVTAKRPGGRS